MVRIEVGARAGGHWSMFFPSLGVVEMIELCEELKIVSWSKKSRGRNYWDVEEVNVKRRWVEIFGTLI